MRLGLDLHGVIDDDPIGFGQIIKDVGQNSSIYIISGPPVSQIQSELSRIGLTKKVNEYCNGVFSVVDYLKDQGVHMWQDSNERWWASEEDWWSSKAAICDKLKVHMMIDDCERYEPYFRNINTKFLLYKGAKHLARRSE